jgi:ketosteroid isomerase-like protein
MTMTMTTTPMTKTRDEAEAFAARWAAAWNDRDIEFVLEHFHEDVVFVSPTALAVVGSPLVRGKDALRSYWAKALAPVESIRFVVHHVLWDPARRELAIIYTQHINGAPKRVSENLTFGDDGRVLAAEVFHGVASVG